MLEIPDGYEELDVTTPDLKVGDILMGAYSSGQTRDQMSIWSRQVVILAPVYVAYQKVWKIHLQHPNPTYDVYADFRPATTRFVVHRKCEHNKNFPHKCPRCGQTAYVGLFEVTHQYEYNAMGCPARRG